MTDATSSGTAAPVSRRRILFVDDEPRILEGLVRMLRPQRASFEVLTAVGGAEALDRLAAEVVDVVVSDMRMPGMDGAELLTRVRDVHPRAVRIILSGQSDLDTILRATACTHQFLAKPCDPEFLRLSVTRACALRDLLPEDDLKRLVSRLIFLPAEPSAHATLREALDGPGSIGRAAQAIANDPGMSAKVVQLVSSAFFGSPHHPKDVRTAVTTLGIDTLRSLMRTGTAFVPWDPAAKVPVPLSARTRLARLARDLAQGIASDLGADPTTAASAAMAAHLHIVGELALAGSTASSPLDGRPGLGPEPGNAAGGYDLGSLGAYLLGLWGIAHPVVDAVAALTRPTADPALVTRAVRIAVTVAFAHLGGPLADLPADDAPGLVTIWNQRAASLVDVDIAGDSSAGSRSSIARSSTLTPPGEGA